LLVGLLTASAIFLGLMGLPGASLVYEILVTAGVPDGRWMRVLTRVTPVLYVGLAVLNWTARDQMSSRSERRPTMVANFVVFLCGAMVLVKAITSDPDVVIFWILAVVYAGFAAAFGEISFRAVKVR
jgi:hypothetical protein